jgi:hypothetical protein
MTASHSRLTQQINGRVIIDAFGFKKFNPSLAPNTKHMESYQIDDEGNEIRSVALIEPSGRNRFEADQKGRLTAEEQELNRDVLTKIPEYLLLLSPQLPGFCLQRNKWCKSPNSTACF